MYDRMKYRKFPEQMCIVSKIHITVEPHVSIATHLLLDHSQGQCIKDEGHRISEVLVLRVCGTDLQI